MPRTVGASSYCLLTRADCLAPEPPCPELMYCDYDWYGVGSQVIVDQPVCRPAGQPLAATGAEGHVWMPNVAPGEYLLQVHHPTTQFAPVRLRVEAGQLILLQQGPW